MRDSFFVFVFVAALLVALVVIGVMELAPQTQEMRPASHRPALHAALNAICAVLLLCGYWLIRQRKVVAHMTCMILAGIVAATFLASYLHYHSQVGSTRFGGTGLVRGLYFTLLISHTMLAALVAPLAGSVYWLAARKRWDKHRLVARVTLPIWLYTSITGVLVYFMLHVWFRGAA